ncbi:MAG: phosphodiester glycosidase family protein [Patescibacteria group bacterium]|nr:phosphodiester glycosidase family protein [Patescibacteria group bacterium]
MKKILFSLFVIISLILIFNHKNNKKVTPLPQEEIKEMSLMEKLDTINYNNKTYPFAFFKVDHPEDLKLFSNFSQIKSSEDIIKEKQSSFLINGGFYDKSNQPLGWFVADNQEISKKIISNLLNGFIQKKDNQIFINSTPLLNVQFGLQSGPILIKNSQPLILKIKNDEFRRRTIATLNQNHQLIFITIISTESEFNGPLLANTPNVLQKISQKINQKFVSAINLDGGSASVFYTPDTYIKEFSPIGSFFCL